MMVQIMLQALKFIAPADYDETYGPWPSHLPLHAKVDWQIKKFLLLSKAITCRAKRQI
jgi:hypothetical protein